MTLDNPVSKVDADQFNSFSLLSLSDYLEDVRRLDKHFRVTAAIVSATWLVLVALTYLFAAEENLERLEGIERIAPSFACCCLLLSLSGRLFTVHFLAKSYDFSGVLIGSVTVQAIAFFTNGMMASGMLVPVMTDPVFGNRVHLLRWCEWTPLAFYMTFLTEGIDLPRGLHYAYKIGSTQGFSTLSGLLLPFARGPLEWTVLMVISCLLYFCMFPCLYSKSKRLSKMVPGVSSHQVELHDRARLSYHLTLTCTVAWTTLVLLYFVSGFGSLFAPPGSFLSMDALNMIWECSMDVILKNLYMNLIVQVHKVTFDDKGRAERRLGELRRLMSAVWESSSDVICVSVRGISGTVRTMVSPSYLRIYHARPDKCESTKALLFDIDLEAVQNRAYSNVKAKEVQSVEFNALPDLKSGKFDKKKLLESGLSEIPKTDLDDNVLSSMAGFIARAWNVDKDASSLNHKLLKVYGEEQAFTPCEANVCRLEDDSLLLVVRDISERSQRFEAEKKMVFETTARKKDAEANRFTRHEVKNGLLAAIGLCESLRETTHIFDSPNASQEFSNNKEMASFQTAALDGPMEPASNLNVSRCTQELDKTLKDVLDTILSEAMARDVIHGVYEPKMERVDIRETLCTSHGATNERFPIFSEPSPFPSLYFDRQLLNNIHRNAVSNACKYGEKGGVVTTIVYFDNVNKVFKMDVINNPGESHERLVQLGNQASDAVFSSGTRLHGEDGIADTKNHSAGDGAWIMRKCAETLKGKASIVFEPHRTIFSFSCPADRFEEVLMTKSVDPNTFKVPPNTWGIAIDDSKIQRKLLKTFFDYAGVEKSRSIILGGTTNEITGFVDYTAQLIERHPMDYFLLIVDENLDFVEDAAIRATVSGSECIDTLRRRLMPRQERRVLALVRSANDSSPDIAIYNSRAHGFISKAPIRKNIVLETIAPLWCNRFLNSQSEQETKCEYQPSKKTRMEADFSDFACLVMQELQRDLDAIDEMCSGDKDSILEEKWPLIWEKLHCLKGDLMSSLNTSEIQEAVNEINSLRGPKLPHNFLSRWGVLRSHIAANIKMQNLTGDELSSGRGSSTKRSSYQPATTTEPAKKKLRAGGVSESAVKSPSSLKSTMSQGATYAKSAWTMEGGAHGNDDSDSQQAKRQRL